jgi:hypothetical protein
MPEPQQETWLKLVVLTVIVLAVASGLAAIKARDYGTQAQIFAAREARQWQDYQVDSIQKDNFGLNRDILKIMRFSEGKSTRGHKSLPMKIKEYEDEMHRLNQERDQIKKVALALAAQQEALTHKAGDLGLAVILFQLAIMSSATGALTRKKILWLAGLALGVWGLVYVVKVLWF